MQLVVLRMGSWARLHPDVKEATLEDKLARLRARIKHENPTRKELQILKEKLVHLQGQKESIIKELNLDVCICLNANSNAPLLLLMKVFLIVFSSTHTSELQI